MILPSQIQLVASISKKIYRRQHRKHFPCNSPPKTSFCVVKHITFGAVDGVFRPKFYGTFCRSRSGERIRVVPVPGNEPRKKGTPPAGNNDNDNDNDKPSPAIRCPGGPPRPATHTHTRVRRSNKPLRRPPRSDENYTGTSGPR